MLIEPKTSWKALLEIIVNGFVTPKGKTFVYGILEFVRASFMPSTIRSILRLTGKGREGWTLKLCPIFGISESFELGLVFNVGSKIIELIFSPES